MKSHEAIQEAIAGKTVEHAKALNLATVTLHKWQEPSADFTDSGNLNPLDRIETIMHTAQRLRRSGNPLAPLHYLAAAVSHAAIPVPRNSGSMQDLIAELLDAVREFGALAEAASAAIVDGDVSRREYEKLDRQAHRACREIMEFLSRAKEARRT